MGLKIGDLADLCLNTITIDKFKSKINEDCIVVSFYILYRDPANDLNRFIQKTAVDIIDTDVSPAPTEDGYYVVFVELMRNDKFPQKIVDLCNVVSGVTGNTDWKFKSNNNDKSLEVTVENVKKTIDGVGSIQERICYFLRDSFLKDVSFNKNSIILETNNKREFDFCYFGDFNSIKKIDETISGPIKLDEESFSYTNRISEMLGPQWCVSIVENKILISNHVSNKILVIKKGK